MAPVPRLAQAQCFQTRSWPWSLSHLISLFSVFLFLALLLGRWASGRPQTVLPASFLIPTSSGFAHQTICCFRFVILATWSEVSSSGAALSWQGWNVSHQVWDGAKNTAARATSPVATPALAPHRSQPSFAAPGTVCGGSHAPDVLLYHTWSSAVRLEGGRQAPRSAGPPGASARAQALSPTLCLWCWGGCAVLPSDRWC